jgi:succinyl-diaminopimelate desuccinylase
MDEAKRQLSECIDADRDGLITFLSRFIQAKSPNPPG